MNISYNQVVFRNPSSSHLQGIHKIYGKKPSTMLNSTALMYKPKESFKTDSSMDESIRVRMCMERIVGVVDTDEELIIFSEKRFSVLYRDYSSDEFLRLNSSQSELLVSGRAKTHPFVKIRLKIFSTVKYRNGGQDRDRYHLSSTKRLSGCLSSFRRISSRFMKADASLLKQKCRPCTLMRKNVQVSLSIQLIEQQAVQ